MQCCPTQLSILTNPNLRTDWRCKQDCTRLESHSFPSEMPNLRCGFVIHVDTSHKKNSIFFQLVTSINAKFWATQCTSFPANRSVTSFQLPFCCCCCSLFFFNKLGTNRYWVKSRGKMLEKVIRNYLTSAFLLFREGSIISQRILKMTKVELEVEEKLYIGLLNMDRFQHSHFL